MNHSSNNSRFLSSTGLFLLVYACFLFTIPIQDPQIWSHLEAGEEIAKNFHFNGLGIAGTASSHNWLSELLFHLFFYYSGFNGLIALRTIIIAAGLMLLFNRYKAFFPYNLLLLLPIVFLTLSQAYIHPQLFAFILQVTLILLLSERKFFYIPLVLVLWANMHISFILGVFISLMFLLREFSLPRSLWREFNTKNAKRKLFFATILIIAAPMLSANGYRVYAVVQNLALLKESFFGNVHLENNFAFIAVWILFLLFTYTLYVLTPVKKWYILVYFISLTILSFIHPYFLLVCALYLLPELFDLKGFIPLAQHHKLGVYVLAGTLLTLSMLFIPASAYFHSPGIGLNKKLLPLYSTKFILKNGLQNGLYTDAYFNDYINWRFNSFAAAKKRKFGKNNFRIQQYSFEQLAKAEDNKDINILLLRTNQVENEKIISTSNWDLAYFDKNTVIYLRKNYRADLMRLNHINPWASSNEIDFEQSIAEAKYLVRINPEYAFAKRILTSLYIKQKSFEQASIQLSESLEGNLTFDTKDENSTNNGNVKLLK